MKQLSGENMDTYTKRYQKMLRNAERDIDRKSTRLNSSHRCISYAVFCLKKKKKKKKIINNKKKKHHKNKIIRTQTKQIEHYARLIITARYRSIINLLHAYIPETVHLACD